MLNCMVFSPTGEQRFIVTAEEKFKVRAAVFEGSPVLAMIDVARHCGLKAPGKAAERFPCEKVKLETKVERGCCTGSAWMIYCSVDDAIEFANNHRVQGNMAFIKFLENIAQEVKNNALATLWQPPTPPVQQTPKAPAAQPESGVNSLSERIDRLIIELLTLKQEITVTT